MASYVVTYDVRTDTAAGRRRLRQIAKLCEDYGQRVQFSVFECQLDEMQLELLLAAAAKIIDAAADSLRAYRLHGARAGAVRTIGRENWIDFCAPLVL
jgi:CRISPR-associated protein Cas2